MKQQQLKVSSQSRLEEEEEEKLIGLPFHFVNSLWKLNINNPGRVSCLLGKTLYVVRKNLCSIRSSAAAWQRLHLYINFQLFLLASEFKKQIF